MTQPPQGSPNSAQPQSRRATPAKQTALWVQLYLGTVRITGCKQVLSHRFQKSPKQTTRVLAGKHERTCDYVLCFHVFSPNRFVNPIPTWFSKAYLQTLFRGQKRPNGGLNCDPPPTMIVWYGIYQAQPLVIVVVVFLQDRPWICFSSGFHDLFVWDRSSHKGGHWSFHSHASVHHQATKALMKACVDERENYCCNQPSSLCGHSSCSMFANTLFPHSHSDKKKKSQNTRKSAVFVSGKEEKCPPA